MNYAVKQDIFAQIELFAKIERAKIECRLHFQCKAERTDERTKERKVIDSEFSLFCAHVCTVAKEEKCPKRELLKTSPSLISSASLTTGVIRRRKIPPGEMVRFLAFGLPGRGCDRGRGDEGGHGEAIEASGEKG